MAEKKAEHAAQDFLADGSETVLSSETGSSVSPCATEDPLLGLILGGHYEIMSVIGSGGMSRVYKARHLLLNRDMAVKFIHPERQLDETVVQRFQREAKAAIGLNHPNIGKVTELGLSVSGTPFLVMDLIEGKSLAQLIKEEGVLDWQRVTRIGVQLCQALQHAHLQNILHRDIKPGNVMVTKSGDHEKALVVDFGIAKVLASEEEFQHLTQTGDVIGSPIYMSPEQCMGKKLDAKSDVYSLGCLLYEALSGNPPLLGTSMLETLHKHINESPAPIKNIPAALNAVVLKALEKNSDDRHEGMQQFGQELEKVLDNPKLAVKPTRKQIGDSLRIAAKRTLSLLALVVIVTVLGFYYQSRIPSARLAEMVPTSWIWIVGRKLNSDSHSWVSFRRNSQYFENPFAFEKTTMVALKEATDLYGEQLQVNRQNDPPTIFVDQAESLGSYKDVVKSLNSMKICIPWAQSHLPGCSSLIARFHKIEADAYFRLRNFTLAKSEYQLALSGLAKTGEHPKCYAEALSRYADCLYFQHNWEEASKWFEKALAEWRTVEASAKDYAEVPIDYALSESRLGDCYRSNHQFAKATSHYRNAAEYWEATKEIQQLAMAHFYLAYMEFLRQQGLAEEPKAIDTYPFSFSKRFGVIYFEGCDRAEKLVKDAFYSLSYGGLLLQDIYALKYNHFEITSRLPREIFDKISALVQVHDSSRGNWPLLGDIKESSL